MSACSPIRVRNGSRAKLGVDSDGRVCLCDIDTSLWCTYLIEICVADWDIDSLLHAWRHTSYEVLIYMHASWGHHIYTCVSSESIRIPLFTILMFAWQSIHVMFAWHAIRLFHMCHMSYIISHVIHHITCHTSLSTVSLLLDSLVWEWWALIYTPYIHQAWCIQVYLWKVFVSSPNLLIPFQGACW